MVKIGVVGNNVDAEFYKALIKQIENIEFNEAFDISTNKTEFEAYLATCDAIYIEQIDITPFEYIVKAFRLGKHVFIKHIATLSLDEIALLLENRKEANVKCMIGCNKYSHAMQLGLFDNIQALSFLESTNYGLDSRNNISALLIEELTVCLSIAQSDIKKIHAAVSAIMKVETDYVNTRLEFSNGLIMSIVINTSSLQGSNKISLIGHKKNVQFDFVKNLHSIVVPDEFGILNEKAHHISIVDNNINQIQNFRDSILGKATPLLKLREGFKILEIAQKVLKK